jgi:bifunctional oligoribonuclease and PAP phosphatase NrnA
MTITKAPEQLLARLRDSRRLLITSHQSPDGDAVGSCLALARLLRGLGKSTLVWLCDEVPSIYRAVPGSERIHTGTAPPEGYPGAFDTVVVLECPSLERTGLGAELAGPRVLNVDHHLGNSLYGEVNWVDTAAPSCGELVHRIAQGLKLKIEPEVATILHLTLVTDTGNFRFSNATADAFDSAAALVRLGARPEQVSLWVYESQPEATIRLMGEMISSLRLHAGGRIATVVLSSEMFTRAGAEVGNTEGLVDLPRSIAGVEAVGLLRQTGPGEYKLSLRSRGEVDVERLARRWGGGGHKNAAGAKLSGTEDEVRETVVAGLEEALAS